MAIENLRMGLERAGHHCVVERDDPDVLMSRGHYDLILLHSFSEENRETYVRCLRMAEALELPHAIVMHDYWAICHQTNLLRPSMGWKRCRVTPDEPCRPGVRCKHPVKNELLRDQVRHRRVVTFTERGADTFRSAGFDSVTVIPHRIDVGAFRFQPKSSLPSGIRVCFTNAWGERDIKGYRHWDWLRRNSGDPNVEFVEALGSLDHDSMPQFLSSCDAMLFLSLWEETFGLVVVESMACGTPVISYPTGVSPDAIGNGYNGYLLDVANPKLAAEAISRLSNMSPSDRESMRAAARASVEGYYGLDRMAGDYVRLAGGTE